MASTTPKNKDFVAATVARLQAKLSKHFQLVRASGPFQCSKRCNETLPDWPTTLDFIIDQFFKPDFQNEAEMSDSKIENFFNKGNKVAASIKDLVENLFDANHHLDRVKVCSCGGKKAYSAGALKVVGNELFSKRQFLLAIKFYSVAMTICPADVNLAVLYSNRSAASGRFGQYENALEDIELAINMQYPREKQGKLFLRKADCLLKLGRTAELSQFLVASMAEPPVFSAQEEIRWKAFKRLLTSPMATAALPNTDLGKYLEVEKVIQTLSLKGRFRTGNKFPWLSAKVELARETDSHKFRIVASEKIEAGEILAIVKPFAVVPLDNKLQKNSFERCHHCTATIYRSAAYIENPALLKVKINSPIRMNNPVACYQCSEVFFCSEDCANESWKKYHRFECGLLPVLGCLGAEARLALRVLYSTGSVKRMHELFLEEVSTSDAQTETIDDEYRQLFHSSSEMIDKDCERKYQSMIATIMLLELGRLSSFFKTDQDCVVGGKVLFRMQSQLRRNLVVVGRRNYCSLSSTDAFDRFQVATGLATIVEPAAEESQANVHLQVLNPLEIVRSNILLLTAKRSLEKGEKLSMDLSSGHFDTSAKAPVVDTELLGQH